MSEQDPEIAPGDDGAKLVGSEAAQADTHAQAAADPLNTCRYGGGRFELTQRGVLFAGTDHEGNQKEPVWVCSPLGVIAKTRDGKSGEWGRLLEWFDDDDVRHQWAMPLELLEGDGTHAAGRCFAAWLDSFGGAGNRGDRILLAQVRGFFETHGASRFEDVGASTDQRVVNRAGFYRAGMDGTREFLVLPEAFKRGVCAGFELKAATQCLLAQGWILPGGDCRPT